MVKILNTYLDIYLLYFLFLNLDLKNYAVNLLMLISLIYMFYINLQFWEITKFYGN